MLDVLTQLKVTVHSSILFWLFFYFREYKKIKEKIPLHIKIFIEHEITTVKSTILLIT